MFRAPRLALLAFLLGGLLPALDASAADGPWDPFHFRPAQFQSLAYDAAHERVLMFGGVDGQIYSNDVWAYSLADPDPHWTLLATVGEPPSPRRSASVVYDSLRDRLIVFGGEDGFTGHSDVWALDLAGDPAWSEIVPTGSGAGYRTGQSVVYDSVHDQLLVFGGDYGNQTHALALSGAPTWTLLDVTDPPPGRGFHGAVFDAGNARMLVVGGTNPYGVTDVWALSFDPAPAWTRLSTGTPYLVSVGHPSVVLDPIRHRLLAFAPYQNTTAGVWAFGLEDTTWSLLPAGAPSHASWTPLAVYDAPRDRVVMLGRAPFDDMWKLPLGEPAAWSLLSASSTRPASRSRHSTLWDAPRNRAIVFGGRGQWGSHIQPQAPLYGDTWALGQDESWTPLAPAGTPPGARQGHTAVYDPVRERMIVFGGQAGIETGPATSEVWALTLSGAPAWTLLAPPGLAPPARWGHTAIVDGANDRMIVFGGTDGTSGFADAWALPLSGTGAWQPLTPAGAPPSARWDASAAYDAARQRMLVFGGWAGDWTTRQNDLYALDLSAAPAWSALAPSGDLPPVHDGHSALVDAANDRMLVFGGEEASDVWALPLADGSAWQPLPLADPEPMTRRHAGVVLDAGANRAMLVLGETRCAGPNCWRDWNVLGDVWSLGLAPSLSVPEPAGPASLLALAPARPTPATGAVTLAFTLPRAGSATLDLYDLGGRRVGGRRLEGLSAGPHTLVLPEVSHLPAGVYLVRLGQGVESRTSRVCVTR